MALTKCPSCEGRMFECVENKNVSGSNFVVMFIQCSKCGAAVGAMDYIPTNTILAEVQKIQKHLGMI